MPIQRVETGAEEREVHFARRQDDTYPHLLRLCMDFNFRVVEQDTGFQLAPQACAAITPAFTELAELERHVQQNMVDILHSYLCDDGLLTH